MKNVKISPTILTLFLRFLLKYICNLAKFLLDTEGEKNFSLNQLQSFEETDTQNNPITIDNQQDATILRCVIPVVFRKTNGEVNISHGNTAMVNLMCG